MTQDNINLIVGLFALTWLVGGLLVYILTRRPEAAALDSEAARRLNELQMTRDVVAIYEKAYREATAIQRMGVDTTAAILRVIAPLTPAKADDAALALLTDIQTPGAPEPTDPNALG